MWITLLKSTRARPPQPDKSRAWRFGAKKLHGWKASKIKYLQPLLDL
jgi:hypothetical protein